MGLKWFRASLSMEKEASKVPAMTGLYRRISFEPAIQKNVEVSLSTAPHLIINDSTSSGDNETAKNDRSRADLTNQTSSSIIDSKEITVKDIDNKPQINNHLVENAESSTSIKDPNVKEESARGEELNKITKDQNMSDTKNPIYSDNELVI
ncbi:PREDICTED: uncharacterized protein LOC108758867 [Trachymyrmex cornetzi]|uniref:uncharacterized protein LOC108758867 n=1 Tax=Trachymyrmex cornetzi TaxID=471704 RepID=UPI00084F3740|nr:PREDICTED: uncharacterized protein LOC108758867 [Trachymyrmex cornetzi]XP_018359568.1 PREDICTED: uncharacterized protein LOC108758867 [Trachymyrmex cornetzi]XP_018359569.1 PREDICTED: uncharacterized protein LOC108758867 [Trachymyrmex cornetzi]